MTLIKAAVCNESKTDLTIEEIKLLSPEQDEIRVSVEACAICHSDTVSYTHLRPTRPY